MAARLGGGGGGGVSLSFAEASLIASKEIKRVEAEERRFEARGGPWEGRRKDVMACDRG